MLYFIKENVVVYLADFERVYYGRGLTIRYQEVLRNIARYSDQDQRVRQAVIKTIRAMHTPPAIPETVMRSIVTGFLFSVMGYRVFLE